MENRKKAFILWKKRKIFLCNPVCKNRSVPHFKKGNYGKCGKERVESEKKRGKTGAYSLIFLIMSSIVAFSCRFLFIFSLISLIA